MAEKRYYWLKLKEDFFDEKYIKALRKMPGGNDMVIVYLKMQLKSLKTEGIINYEQIMPSPAEELALVLDEDLSIVKATLLILEKLNVVEMWEDATIYMRALQELIGSESTVASRVRKHREKKALQCNNKLLQEVSCNTEIEIDIEKEKDKEVDIDIDKEIEDSQLSRVDCGPKVPLQMIIDSWNSNSNLSKITKIHQTSNRYKMLRARINQYGLEDVIRAIENIRNSDFLQGFTSDFKVTFDWFIKPNNFIKVLDGNYNNKAVKSHENKPISKNPNFTTMHSHNWDMDKLDEMAQEYLERRVYGND